MLIGAMVCLSGCTIFGPSNDDIILTPTVISSETIGIRPAHNCIILNRYENKNEKDFSRIYTGTDPDESGMESLRESARLAGRDTRVKTPLCRPKANIIVKVP